MEKIDMVCCKRGRDSCYHPGPLFGLCSKKLLKMLGNVWQTLAYLKPSGFQNKLFILRHKIL